MSKFWWINASRRTIDPKTGTWISSWTYDINGQEVLVIYWNEKITSIICQGCPDERWDFYITN